MDLSQPQDHILILVEEKNNFQLDATKYPMKAKDGCLVPIENECLNLFNQTDIVRAINNSDMGNNGVHLKEQNNPNIKIQNKDNISEAPSLRHNNNNNPKAENGLNNPFPTSFIEGRQLDYGNIKIEYSNIKIKSEPNKLSPNSAEKNLDYDSLKMEPQKIESQEMSSCFEPADIKLFACDLCSYKSNKARNLRTHKLRTHIAKETFQCDLCEFKTKYRRNLRLHTLKHTGEKPFHCDQCDYRTPSTSNLHRHKRVHLAQRINYLSSYNKTNIKDAFNGDKPFHCDQCEFMTHSKNNLRHHRQRHNGLKPYQCEFCQFCTSTNYSLKRHMLLHTRDKDYFKCSLCSFQTKNNPGFKSHLEWHRRTTIKPEIMNLIKKELIKEQATPPKVEDDYQYSPSELKPVASDEVHIPDIEEVMFKCNHCQFVGNLFVLKTHTILSHPDIKPFANEPSTSEESNTPKKKRNKNKQYKCDQCDFVSSAFEKLKLHKWIHVRDKPFQCDQCNYRTVKRYLLVIHQRQHTGERPFRCDQCDYGAASRDTLRRHKLKHVGGKLFRCDHCGYRTATSTSLRIHMLSHTAKNINRKRHRSHRLTGKKFPCNQCDYVTIKNSILILHKQKHIEEKPYQCEECDFNGQSYLALQRHLIRHRKEKLFKCDYCEFETSANKYLKTHMLNIHSDEITIQCEDSISENLQSERNMCNENNCESDVTYATVILNFSETANYESSMNNDSGVPLNNCKAPKCVNGIEDNVATDSEFKIKIKSEYPEVISADFPSEPVPWIESQSSKTKNYIVGDVDNARIVETRNWFNHNPVELENTSKDENCQNLFFTLNKFDVASISNKIKSESLNNEIS